MAKKTTPTFRRNLSDKLLTGKAAIAEWAAQTARCGCGDHGDKDSAISGEANNMPAKWLGCPNCTGRTVGLPLIYRLPSQMLPKH